MTIDSFETDAHSSKDIQAIELPPYRISTEFGDLLKDEVLQDVAEFFALTESFLLEILGKAISLSLGGQTSLSPESRSVFARDQVLISQVQKQFIDIRTAKRQFCIFYLRETFVLPLLIRAKSVISQLLSTDPTDPLNTPWHTTIDGCFRRIEQRVVIIPERISTAVARRILREDERAAIRLRWIELDSIFDMYNEKSLTKRTWPKW